MIHVTIQQLSSYLDEQLAEGSAEIVRQHLAACPECEAKLDALSLMDTALTQALSHEPDEDVLRRLEREIASSLVPDARAKAGEILAASARATPAGTPTAVRGNSSALAAGGRRKVAAPAAARTGAGPHGSARAGAAAAAGARSSSVRSSSTSSARTTAGAPAGAVPERRVRDVPATAWTPSTARGAVARAPEPGRPKGSSAGTWIAIFSLAVIAGSAGVVVSHSGTVQGWLDGLIARPNFTIPAGGPSAVVDSVAAGPADSAAALDLVTGLEAGSGGVDGALVPGAPAAASGSGAPANAALSATPPAPPGRARDDSDAWDADAFAEEETTPRTMSADEALGMQDASAASGRAHGGAQRSDPYAHLRPEDQAAVREAERLHQQTLFHPTAEQFDMAALRWERALEGMSGPEQVTVRGRLADARYRAWEAGPNAQRADQAIAAIRSYLLFAPPGVAREEAKARLERLAPR